jgi:hypothetical protein
VSLCSDEPPVERFGGLADEAYVVHGRSREAGATARSSSSRLERRLNCRADNHRLLESARTSSKELYGFALNGVEPAPFAEPSLHLDRAG